MRSILIPTNFSASSGRAVRFAIELAGKNEVRFSLIHVYTNECLNLFPSYRDRAVGIMKNIIDEYKLTDHFHRCFVREGDVSDCIAKAIHEHGDSLVIMVKKVVPGDGSKQGTAFKIIQKASCPVLFIPQGWSHRVKEILLCRSC